VPLLAAAGIEVTEDVEKSRKLIFDTNRPDVRVVLVRASDVPVYVQYGGADLGVSGLDSLIEHGGQGLYQPLDLQIAKCRVSVAVRNGFDYSWPSSRARVCALPPSTPRLPATSLPRRACTWTWSSSTAPWSWRR
jgi:ATP phosphoribosyltransferase